MTVKSINDSENRVSRVIAEHFIAPTRTRTVDTAKIVFCPPDDPTREQSHKLIEQSATVDFWGRPEEDGYTESDGEPI